MPGLQQHSKVLIYSCGLKGKNVGSPLKQTMDFPLKRDILLLHNITDTNTLKYTGACYQHRDAQEKLLSLHHFFLLAEWEVLYYCMGKSSLGQWEWFIVPTWILTSNKVIHHAMDMSMMSSLLRSEHYSLSNNFNRENWFDFSMLKTKRSRKKLWW